MLPKDKYPQVYELFQPAEMARLQSGIEKLFDAKDLGRLLFYAGWDWDEKIQAGGFDERVFGLVRYLNQVGQLHWLVNIVDDARANYEIFTTLRAKVTPPLPPVPASTASAPQPAAHDQTPAEVGGTDPWKMVLLHTDQPFLDRTVFREECRLVGVAKTKPILSVTGDPDTGKSYTARYLAGVGKFLCVGDDAFVTKEIHLDRLNGVVDAGAAAEISGLRLARRLSLAITDETLDSHIVNTVGSEQEAAWAADAANWIMSKAQSQPMRWIIFDGFKTAVLSPSAVALINSLVAQVATDAKVRIALLGYPGNLSWCTSVLRHAELEMAEFSDPTQLTKHVINYLLEVRKAAEHRKRPPFTDDQLEAELRAVLGGVDLAAPNLHALEASLTAIAERVLVGG
jgi:hypothetical protein